MHCPRGDNLLIAQKPHHTDGLSLHYLSCPTCQGHWLSAFDANYISSLDLTGSGLKAPQGLTPFNTKCPQCRKALVRATGDNVPPDVLAFRCPDNHGYFFPAGELKKFKEAQEINIAYHEKWHIPLASVASAMLMTFVGLVLSGGLIVGVIEGQKQQTITSQASELITSQKVYADSRGVTIIAMTSEKTELMVVVDGQEYSMTAPDEKSHVVRIAKISPGDHHYFFRFQKDGITLQSASYSFSSFSFPEGIDGIEGREGEAKK